MTCLGHRDGFPMVSALVCMVIHWIGPTMNHEFFYQIVMIHQTTMLQGLSTFKASAKVISSFDL